MKPILRSALLFRRLSGALCLTLAASGAAYCQFDMGGGQAEEVPAWKQFNLNPKARVSLDFRNASIDAILQMLSQASGITIIKDPALTGGITLQSPKAQSLGDAFSQLNAVLTLKGYAIEKEGNFLIVRVKQQRGFGRGNFDASQFTGRGASGGPQLKVYPIKYANATQVARVVNEVFATPPGAVNPALAAMAAAAGQTTPQPAGNGGGNNPFGFGRRNRGGGGGGGGNGGGQGRFGSSAFGGGATGGFGGDGTPVKASADDYSNSVIVNASSRDQEQVSQIISQLDRQTEQPQQSRVFPLQYANAAQIAPVVQNVLVSNSPRGRGGQGSQTVPIDQRFQAAARFGSTQAAFGTVVADARTNSVIVTGTTENLDLVGKIIQQLDKEVTYESSTFVVTLSNARSDSIAQLLNQSFGSRTGSTGGVNRATGLSGGQNQRQTGASRPATLGTGGRSRAVPMGDGNASATTRSQGLPADSEVEIALANPDADAGELATNVSVQQGFPFQGFGGGGGGGGFGGGRQQQQAGPTGLDAQGRVTNVRDLTGDVTAIADINTNSVIIVTSPQNRALIQSILEQLDKIPEQVMIETLIVEASLDATKKLGVEWSFLQNSVFGDSKVKGNGTQSFGDLANVAQPQGLRYTLTGVQYTAFLQALQTDSQFEVLSTPRIFTSNNSTAEINISQSLPYVTNQRTDNNGNLIFSYAFLDVGIILTVTPRITSNGYVTMDVSQTANDFVGYTSFNAPIVNQREAQTTVSVRDGETVVLGGIIKNSIQTTVNKLPILGDLPVLGNLFKSTTTQKNKTELLVFLTPRVVRDPTEAQKLRETTEKQLQKKTTDRLQDYRKTAPPVSTSATASPIPPPTATPTLPPSATPAPTLPTTPIPNKAPGTPPPATPIPTVPPATKP